MARLASVGVLGLDDGGEPAALVEDQTAVAAGVGGLEAEDDDGRAPGAGVEHRLAASRGGRSGVSP